MRYAMLIYLDEARGYTVAAPDLPRHCRRPSHDR